MWLLSGIKNTYKKSEAASIVQTLLKPHADEGILSLDSEILANKLIAFAWDLKPDIFNGKFGQRPHKIIVAAFALANGIDLVAQDKQNQSVLAIALSTILSEVETNERLYPFNSLDYQLLETSMTIFLEFSKEMDDSPLGKEIDMLMDTAPERTDKLAETRKAAEQGDAISQYNLGVAYLKGLYDVVKDEAKAVMWYHKAAEQGFAGAQYALGVMYANGVGVAKDENQAVLWYCKAAEQGDAAAQYNLALAFVQGKGVAKNSDEAIVWCRKAAEQGHKEAHKALVTLEEIYCIDKAIEKENSKQ